jgi:hypothetical protein
MDKLTPEEILKSIEETPDASEPEEDEDILAVLAMTPEARLRELEGHGYTRAQLDAEAAALLGVPAKTAQAVPKAIATKPPVSSTREVVALRTIPFHRRFYPYAVAAGLALTGAVTWLTQIPATEVIVGHGADPLETAAHLRTEAQKLAGEEKWKEAREMLDRAKDLDPKGEEAKEVAELRRQVEEKLGPPEGEKR